MKNYFTTAANPLKQPNSKLNLWKRVRLPILAGAFYAMMPAHHNIQEETAIDLGNVSQCTTLYKTKNIFSRIWQALLYISRFFQLMVIFGPSMLLSPLMFFKSTEHLWMDLFVKSVEKAGVVFIKTFQYLSHRRDIIGPELSAKFGYLREQVPTHSYATTCRLFRQGYGK